MRFNHRAKGRTARRVVGKMNRLELAYATKLALAKEQGEILWFEFEAIKFRLADKTFYTPDFLVMKPDGELEVHEVKGFWEQHARIKIKVAAEKFPFRFVAIQYLKKQWSFEEF